MTKTPRALALSRALVVAFASLAASPLVAQAGADFNTSASLFMFGDLPALCSMDFQYSVSDDRHLKTLKGIPDLAGNNFVFELADNDHDQMVSGIFRWWDRAGRGNLRFATRSNCRDGCYLNMPVITSAEEMVLAGVDLRFTGTDRHIRDIEVWPEPELGRIWVRFRDNSTANAFNATIAYVLIPSRDHYRFTSNSTTDEWSIVDRPKSVGTSYLQGFKVRFRNGDHHLKRFYVDVCTSRLRGTLHDAGGVNDPYRLDVRYVAYQPIY